MKKVTNQDVQMCDIVKHNETGELWKVISIGQIPYMHFEGASQRTNQIKRFRFTHEEFTVVQRRVANPHLLNTRDL